MPLSENIPEEREPLLSELPPNFAEILGRLFYQKTSEDPTTRLDYATTENDFRKMARGDDPEGIRQDHYPDWTDDNFKLLCKKLGIDVDDY